MKTIEENDVLFEEARQLRKKLKQNLHQNACNVGYCMVEFNILESKKVNHRLIEKIRRRKRLKK